MLRFFNKRIHNRKGFTLIELIVVIAILAILALIAIPRLAGFTESARQANDKEAAAVVANAGAMWLASNPTADAVTPTNLTDTELILASDLELTSRAYGGADGDTIEAADIDVTAERQVVVTLGTTDATLAPTYVITK